MQAFKFQLSTQVVFEQKFESFENKMIFLRNFVYNARVSIILGNEEDCSWHMLRCVHMFHNKCIQTWKASCKSEPDYGVCPQCRKPFRKLLCLTISRGGRSHATILRPSSSHDLDSILVSLELPVSIYFQTIL